MLTINSLLRANYTGPYYIILGNDSRDDANSNIEYVQRASRNHQRREDSFVACEEFE